MERHIMFSIISLVIATSLIVFTNGGKLPPQCNCNCPGSQLVCGKDPKTGNLETFNNPCQMICQNCIYKEKWVIVKQGECKPSNGKRSLTPAITPSTPLKVISKAEPASKQLPQKGGNPPRIKTLSVGG